MLEQEKYETMWTHQRYRSFSPGEKIHKEILKKLNPEEGSTFIDFGCGTGRAAQKIQDLGYEITGVDFAHNCLDTDVDIPFVVRDLGNGDLPKGDYGICTDVMEHIPTEEVPMVLDNICKATPIVFFQIAMFKDSMGRLIGEPLHLTVKDRDWWVNALSKHFTEVDHYGDNRNFKAVCYL